VNFSIVIEIIRNGTLRILYKSLEMYRKLFTASATL